MQQKIIQIGNSSGIILPQSIRQHAGLRLGDRVKIDSKGQDIIISSIKKKKVGGVNPKFMKMVDEFINDHEDVLRELAKK